METAYKPGPFRVVPAPEGYMTIMCGPFVVADVYRCARNVHDPERCVEHAHLFAASPALLRVAEFFADCLKMRAQSHNNRRYAEFRERWAVPEGMSLDDFSTQMVTQALTQARAGGKS